MKDFIIKIYDYLRVHKALCVCLIVLSTLLLSLQLLSINYKEDISDFLPLDINHRKSLKIYQDISGVNRVFAIVQLKDTTETDPDLITQGIQAFSEQIQKSDKNKMIFNLVSQVDISAMTQVVDFIYENIPLFLSNRDYERLDSLLSNPNYIKEQLSQDKEMMMFPSGGILVDNIQRDPLNLFSPILSSLQSGKSGISYEMYDGYIFSPDMQKGIVIMTSPFGSSETEQNTQLINLLDSCASEVTSSNAKLDIHIIGGPSIAVGNAKQIKSDSILAVAIAALLISLLLFYCFRNLRNLLLIVVAIAWGWLFAMAGLSLFHDNISIIVVGISSVIIGIAVNYPLHVIAHLSHTPNVRMALKEIVMPLLIGNITTVGAFMALIPIDSIALRDLGIFCSLLLIGTIIFVLIFLPHLVKTKKESKEITILGSISDFSLENRPMIIAGIILLTCIFAYFSFTTSFDSNMNHINYMTEEQRSDMEYFSNMISNDSKSSTIYVVSEGSTIDAAIYNHNEEDKILLDLKNDGLIYDYVGCSKFITSKKEQEERVVKWNHFVEKYAKSIKENLSVEAKNEGFSSDAFDPFYTVLSKPYRCLDFNEFNVITSTLFTNNISIDKHTGTYSFIHTLSVDKTMIKVVEDKINEQNSNSNSNFCFDIQSMNSALATNLSNNFNYIGWACGFIVFFFLWFSFGSIELAMLSFLPMALSWIWILGLMSIFDIQFNIVNVILATFIFGQGDDYTIFMTEGACYEYTYRKKMLASYKNSIVISALIMFVGIGTLIFAKHPALHSLAEVTIVGMLSVVLMAYLIPSLVFRWLVSENAQTYRIRPISIKPLCSFIVCYIGLICEIITVYICGLLLFVVTKGNDKKRAILLNYLHKLSAFNLAHLPAVTLSIINEYREKFEKPSIIICNHQSTLDSMVCMALSPKCILAVNSPASKNIILKQIFKWIGCLNITDIECNIAKIAELRDKGYSVVIFPEGEINEASSITKFNKEPFYIAEKLHMDIVPVFLHGFNQILSRKSICLYSGSVSVMIDKRISADDTCWGASYIELTTTLNMYYSEQYQHLLERLETSDYFIGIVKDRYRYKGVNVYSSVKKTLNKIERYTIASYLPASSQEIIFIDSSYGESAILFALVYKRMKVYVYNEEESIRDIIKYSADGLTNNLEVLDQDAFMQKVQNESTIYVFSNNDLEKYREYNIIPSI